MSRASLYSHGKVPIVVDSHFVLPFTPIADMKASSLGTALISSLSSSSNPPLATAQSIPVPITSQIAESILATNCTNPPLSTATCPTTTAPAQPTPASVASRIAESILATNCTNPPISAATCPTTTAPAQPTPASVASRIAESILTTNCTNPPLLAAACPPAMAVVPSSHPMHPTPTAIQVVKVVDSVFNNIDFNTLQFLYTGSYGRTYIATYKAPNQSNRVVLKVKRLSCKTVLFRQEAQNLRWLKENKVRHVSPLLEEIANCTHPKFLNNYVLIFPHCGYTVERVLKENTLSIGHLRYFGCQLLETLSDLRKKEVAHGDLSRNNVLFKKDCDVTVIDWASLSRVPKKIGGDITTRYYRAPEFFLGKEDYDESIDIWSLACLLYEMATKKVLFCSVSVDRHIAATQMMIMFISELGCPSSDYIKNSSRKNEFFISNPDGSYTCKFIPIGELWDKLKFAAKTLEENKETKEEVQDFVDLLKRMLQWDPQKRINADEALLHPFFKEKKPLPNAKK